MSITRLFNEFRPLFRMLDEPLLRSPNASALRTRPFFDDPFFASPLSSFPGTGLRPVVDVSEDGNKYIVEAELPGVKKENVEVRIGDDGRSVTIQGKVVSRMEGTPETQNQNQPLGEENTSTGQQSDGNPLTKSTNEPNQLSVERHFVGNSTFTRTVWLPRPVDSSGVTAKLNDGVLTITVPKAEDKGSVVIQVN